MLNPGKCIESNWGGSADISILRSFLRDYKDPGICTELNTDCSYFLAYVLFIAARHVICWIYIFQRVFVNLACIISFDFKLVRCLNAMVTQFINISLKKGVRGISGVEETKPSHY